MRGEHAAACGLACGVVRAPLQQTCRFRLQARIEGAVHTEQTISDHQRQHRLRVAPPVALDKRQAITFMIDRRPLTEGLCPTNNWIGGRGAVSLTAVFAGMPIASKARCNIERWGWAESRFHTLIMIPSIGGLK